MYIRRHNYDKPWRCPGWSGGGWRYAGRLRCPNGSLDIYNRPLRKEARDHWRLSRCSKCDVRAIPYVTRWLDPTYLWFRLKRVPARIRDYREIRRWRRERRAERERGGTFP
jgi:hypothetical protein